MRGATLGGVGHRAAEVHRSRAVLCTGSHAIASSHGLRAALNLDAYTRDTAWPPVLQVSAYAVRFFAASADAANTGAMGASRPGENGTTDKQAWLRRSKADR